MKKTVLQFFHKLARYDIDTWFFVVLLITIPLSIRKVFLYVPLRGSFNEYADVSLYASDAALFGFLMAFIIKEYHNIDIMSIYKKCFTRNISGISLERALIIALPGVLVILAGISLINAMNPMIGFVAVLRIIEFYGLYLTVCFWIVSRETNTLAYENRVLKKVLLVGIASGVAQSAIGIMQFIQQKSLGITFLKESVIDPKLPGVAKIIVNGDQYIRAYGTFPHPNILGGFLFVAIVATHFYFKMFHVKHKWGAYGKWLAFCIQYLGMILTFSKSAILALVIALLYIGVVSRGTDSKNQMAKDESLWLKNRLFHMKQKSVQTVFGVGVAILAVSTFFRINVDALLFQSLREREVYQSIAFDIINKHPILGISCGQLVIFMSKQDIYPLLDWQLQPVHNVFLLIWAEIGVIGFYVFLLWYILLIITPMHSEELSRRQGFSSSGVSRGTRELRLCETYSRSVAVGLLIILLLDHYLWDIQQGQCILGIVFGTLAGCILYNKNEYYAICNTANCKQ